MEKTPLEQIMALIEKEGDGLYYQVHDAFYEKNNFTSGGYGDEDVIEAIETVEQDNELNLSEETKTEIVAKVRASEFWVNELDDIEVFSQAKNEISMNTWDVMNCMGLVAN